ncbi:MAG: hypothetical protein Q8S03_16610 [Brevundimonas sp.]|uniref:hypothetical protein n=1 Tax=Brevundimonas sp. TaxID=1871086 RepID=UPI0027352771|nr:hypothetical protein [Brevundimonas sp.]MDP3406314.1 hypothetical protein [Brevundimonas sp.]
MNAGLNLLTALFLLAPGFGAFAGVYFTGLRRPFRPAPAAPGSLLALALVTVGALLAHGLSSIPYAIQEGVCSQVHCIAVPFQPNPYVTLIDPTGVADAPGISLTIALLHLVVVAVLGFGLGWGGMKVASGRRSFQSFFYGWTDELTNRAPTRYHAINAFVVTDVTHDQLSLGYEGTLLDLRQEASGKFLSATLRDVQAFVIELQATEVKRAKVPRRDPIPFMVLEAENVKNVALALYFDAKAAAAVTQDEIDKMTGAERAALETALVAAKEAEVRDGAGEPPKPEPDAPTAPEPAKGAARDAAAGTRAAASTPTAGKPEAPKAGVAKPDRPAAPRGPRPAKNTD